MLLMLVLHPNAAQADGPQNANASIMVHPDLEKSFPSQHRKLRLELLLSGGLLLMDTAYTQPLEGTGGELKVDDRQIGGFGSSLGLAVAGNYAAHFGLRARLNGGYHWMAINYGDGPNTYVGGVTQLAVDITHLFGPFGPFYVGPNLEFAWYNFSRSMATVATESKVMIPTAFPNGLSLGPGLDTGLYFGRKNSFHLNFRFNVEKQWNAPRPSENGDIILQARVGFGYSFFAFTSWVRPMQSSDFR